MKAQYYSLLSISMSFDGAPHYQGSKTNQQKRKDSINRPRLIEQNEQQTKAGLDSLQEEIGQDRRELIALAEREIVEGKREGRVIGTARGCDVVQLVTRSHNETRYYHFARLPRDTILIAISSMGDHQEGKEIHIATKFYFLNTKDAVKDEQKISVGVLDIKQRKLIGNQDIDPEKERDVYESYDKATPTLREMREDLGKNKTK